MVRGAQRWKGAKRFKRLRDRQRIYLSSSGYLLEASTKPAFASVLQNSNPIKHRRSNSFKYRRSNSFKHRCSNPFKHRGSNSFKEQLSSDSQLLMAQKDIVQRQSCWTLSKDRVAGPK